MCCLAVVKDFHKLRKYNIQSLVQPPQTSDPPLPQECDPKSKVSSPPSQLPPNPLQHLDPSQTSAPKLPPPNPLLSLSPEVVSQPSKLSPPLPPETSPEAKGVPVAATSPWSCDQVAGETGHVGHIGAKVREEVDISEADMKTQVDEVVSDDGGEVKEKIL